MPIEDFEDPLADPRVATINLTRTEFVAVFASANMAALVILQTQEMMDQGRELTEQERTQQRAAWISASLALNVIGADRFNALMHRVQAQSATTWPGRITMMEDTNPQAFIDKVKALADEHARARKDVQ